MRLRSAIIRPMIASHLRLPAVSAQKLTNLLKKVEAGFTSLIEREVRELRLLTGTTKLLKATSKLFADVLQVFSSLVSLELGTCSLDSREPVKAFNLALSAIPPLLSLENDLRIQNYRQYGRLAKKFTSKALARMLLVNRHTVAAMEAHFQFFEGLVSIKWDACKHIECDRHLLTFFRMISREYEEMAEHSKAIRSRFCSKTDAEKLLMLGKNIKTTLKRIDRCKADLIASMFD